MNITEKFWSADHFPVVYESDEARAVIVDMESFKKKVVVSVS